MSCKNCRHVLKSANDNPCNICKSYDMFEPAVDSIREKTLETAKNMIMGQREQDYGSPENNFKIIADLWSDYLGQPITPLDVSMLMILLKVARIKSGGGTGDSFVDIAGYSACGAEIREGTVK